VLRKHSLAREAWHLTFEFVPERQHVKLLCQRDGNANKRRNCSNSHASNYVVSEGICRMRTQRARSSRNWQPAHSLHKLQEIPFITCDSRVRRNKFSLLSQRASSIIKRERKKEEAAAAACQDTKLHALGADHLRVQFSLSFWQRRNAVRKPCSRPFSGGFSGKFALEPTSWITN
jgi:hypothetical protein